MNTIIPENEWILPCNPNEFNLSKALKGTKIIDWRQVKTIRNAKVGDILYFYISDTIGQICYKGAILKVHKLVQTIDDSLYGGNKPGNIVPGTEYMEVAVFREYSVNGLSYVDLKAHGLKVIRGPVNINNELSEYLHKIDRLQLAADRFDHDIPETCLVPFPIDIDEGIEEKQDKKEDELMPNTSVNVELNTILFGPPGTGKTYNTMIYAVAIVENVPVENIEVEAAIDDAHYLAVKARYDKYCQNNRIAFTTFHQSYGYEEFIEGIRPMMNNEIDQNESEDENDKKLEYELRAGVFKKFCEDAKFSVVADAGQTSQEFNIDRDASIWKISLQGAGDNPTRTDCMQNGYIRIGWDQYGADIDAIDPDAEGLQILKAFKDKLQVGDIVLSCYSKRKIDAIGIVTGDYYYLGDKDYYNRARDVEWIVKGIDEDIVDINGGKVLTLSTLYRLNNIKVSDIVDIIRKYKNPDVKPKITKDNHVMIIDEINRGNISKIFGELITLIEPTKRAGASEEMSVVLPYSQKPFSVPSNVYILGTMNTADRSIALLDTALRRRFSFVEMLPKPELLKDFHVTEGDKSVDLPKMLTKINERIEYLYDREHTIGHAFFMKLKKESTVSDLAKIFRNEIIPLLQEYFYEDYNQIQLVLGDNGKPDDQKMILDKAVNDKDLFAKNANNKTKTRVPEIEDDECTYEVQKDALLNIDSYIAIYS